MSAQGREGVCAVRNRPLGVCMWEVRGCAAASGTLRGCVWERKGVSAQGRKGYARGTAMVESAGSGLRIQH